MRPAVLAAPASAGTGSAPWERSQRSRSARFTGGSRAGDGDLSEGRLGGPAKGLARVAAAVRAPAVASSPVRPWLIASGTSAACAQIQPSSPGVSTAVYPFAAPPQREAEE
jgi:hypothetical protein